MELTIGNHVYETSGNLNTFEQLHVARKLGPAVPMVQGLLDPANADKDKELLFVLMLSQIDDASTEYIVQKCLSVVKRKQPTGPSAPIQTKEGTLMFDDIGLAGLIELTVAVIEENLGDFFRTALAQLPLPD